MSTSSRQRDDVCQVLARYLAIRWIYFIQTPREQDRCLNCVRMMQQLEDSERVFLHHAHHDEIDTLGDDVFYFVCGLVAAGRGALTVT
jgi:hypothetical protein